MCLRPRKRFEGGQADDQPRSVTEGFVGMRRHAPGVTPVTAVKTRVK